MAGEIFSLAVLEAQPGKTEELRSCLQELYSLMHAKGYCRDELYQDSSRADRFVHLRCWTSAETRAEAQIDPEVHRYWQRLPDLCTIPVLHDSLDVVFETK